MNSPFPRVLIAGHSLRADDLMIHSGKQGSMTSGLSFPHRFYQLPLESQHVGGQEDCTLQSQAVLPVEPSSKSTTEGPSMTPPCGNSEEKQRLCGSPRSTN